MTLDISQITNKQRILITGNHGLEKISAIVKHVLSQTGKSFQFVDSGDEVISKESSIIIFKGMTQLVNGEAFFHQIAPHIALIHKISKKLDEGYEDWDQFIGEFEKMADNLPKAGTIIYNDADNVATMIGKKEREDVKPIEYSSLPAQKTNSGFLFSFNNDGFEVITANENFLAHAAAAKALLKRIGISDEQFFNALKAI